MRRFVIANVVYQLIMLHCTLAGAAMTSSMEGLGNERARHVSESWPNRTQG